MTIDGVTADVQITVKTAAEKRKPLNFRWESQGSDLFETENANNTRNKLTKLGGSVSNGVLSNTYYKLDTAVQLRHDSPWVMEWACAGDWSGMLLSEAETASQNGNSYLFRTTGDNEFVGFGERRDGNYHNYGIALADFGIDPSAYHHYRLENRWDDETETNMVYLTVDGVELGAMNNYFIGGSRDQNQTVDWVSGKDFVFSCMGAASHALNNMKPDFVQIWENHVHTYESTVTQPTCTEKGYTTYTCTCGDSYTGNEVAALGHTEVTDKAVAATCTEPGLTEGTRCSVCEEVLVKQETVPATGVHIYEMGLCRDCGIPEPTQPTEPEVPETTVPAETEPEVPETTAPEETEPEIPETTEPEETEPEVPETTAPEETEPEVPETTVPAETEPEIPETTEPEETEPEIPETTAPEETEPEVPETTEPEETEPEVPETTEPAETEPEIPETTEPEETEPEVPETTEPAETEPEIPETTVPEETEPEVPEITAPKETEPEVPETTAPEETEPEIPETTAPEEVEPVKPEAPKIKGTNAPASGKPRLTWEKVEGAVRYEIWRSTGKNTGFTRVWTQKGTTYTNTKAVAGERYYYKVKAVDADGNVSEFSNRVTRMCDLPRPEVKATNVASSGKVKLTWKAVEGAVKYQIWRSTTGKPGSFKRIRTQKGTTYINTNAKVGTRYYYKVKAIHADTNANSAFSVIDRRMCDLARPVVSIRLTASGVPRISWQKAEGAVKYEVWRATSRNGTYTRIATTRNLYQVNTNAKAGQTYYYKVRAIHADANANSAFSTIKYIKAK